MGHLGTLAVNLSLYPQLPYDPVKGFAPVPWGAPELKSRLNSEGAIAMPTASQALGQHIVHEIARWKPVIQSGRVKADRCNYCLNRFRMKFSAGQNSMISASEVIVPTSGLDQKIPRSPLDPIIVCRKEASARSPSTSDSTRGARG